MSGKHGPRLYHVMQGVKPERTERAGPRIDSRGNTAELVLTSEIQKMERYLAQPDIEIPRGMVNRALLPPLLACVRQVTQRRVYQLLRETRDCMLLLMQEVPLASSGTPPDRVVTIARRNLNLVEAWLENAGLNEPSKWIEHRMKEAGL